MANGGIARFLLLVLCAAPLAAAEQGVGDHREVTEGVHLHDVIGGELYERLCVPEGGALPGSGSWSARPNTTVRNNFGPEIGGRATRCRGSCGGDCSPNNCQDKGTFLECVDAERYRVVQVYECHTQAGCRSHDDCLDRCAERYPGEGRFPAAPPMETWVEEWIEQAGDWRPNRNFYTGPCSSCCHIEAFRTYGWDGAGALWKDGFESTVHPRDGGIRFEYTKDLPSQEEELGTCPERFRLECDPEGRAECVLNEVIVDIAPEGACLAEGKELPMSAQVLGTDETGVAWTVVEGPGRIGAGGVLEGTGRGEVIVRGTSVANTEVWDEAVVRVGTCECSFVAAVTGDSSRGLLDGETATFSTRGAVGSMASGGLDGPAAADFLTDLADMMEAMGGLTGGDPEMKKQFADRLRQQVGGSDAGDGDAPLGRTVTMSFIEGGALAPGSFHLDLMAEATIEPGFAGPLPVSGVFLSTGERAADGGAPWMFSWEEGEPGRAALRVESYDGEWLVGRLDVELEGAEGLLVGGRRPRIGVGLEFTAGANNPLQFQNVCLMTQVMEEPVP